MLRPETVIYPQKDSFYCVFSRRPAGFAFSQKKPRSSDTLIFQAEGSLRFRIEKPEKEEILLRTGEFLYLPAGTECVSETLAAKNANFNFFFLPIGEGLAPSPTVIPASEATDRAMNEAVSAYEKRGVREISFYFSIFYRLLFLFSERERSDRGYSRIRPAVLAIEREFTENRKIGDYAKSVFMSEVQFRRSFHRIFGVSPVAYRNGLRMRFVRELLAEGFPLSEAIENAGFSSPSFYYRLKSRETKE